MTKHTSIRKTVDSFRERFEDCPECNGTGRRCSDYYDRGSDCVDCDGSGVWTAACADCGEARDLNDDGVCRECAALDLAYSELKSETRTQWL
jgi:RecJ-like exonuclease